MSKLDGEWVDLIEQVMAEGRIELGGFRPERVVITKGSYDRPYQRRFAERICETIAARVPHVEIHEALDRSHMEITLKAEHGARPDEASRRKRGKRTLVIGAIRTPLKLSTERGIMCPNYWSFSSVGYCWYECEFCYLGGTKSIAVSPAVKIFVNLEDILSALSAHIVKHPEPRFYYLGKLQDSLSLDPLTGYSRILIPFFASQEQARQLYLTKSARVSNLLPLDHRGHTTVSWSINPSEICQAFEHGAPSLDARLRAARACADAGYPVRLQVMPLIPIDDWRDAYRRMVEQVFATVVPERLTLGGICIYPGALKVMELRWGRENPVSKNIDRANPTAADGRIRYPRALRVEMYRFLIDEVRRRVADLPISLCLEEAEVWEQAGLDLRRTMCNCVLTAVDQTRRPSGSQ